MFFILSLIIFKNAYSIHYTDVKSGTFGTTDQTGFITLAQLTEEQELQNNLTVIVDGANSLSPSNTIKESRFLSIADVNSDGKDDFASLNNTIGTPYETEGEAGSFYFSTSLYESSLTTDNDDLGNTFPVVNLVQSYGTGFVIYDYADISNYNTLLLGDFNHNGHADFLYLGWDDTNGKSSTFWYLGEHTFTGTHWMTVHKSHGSLPAYAHIENAFIFNEENNGPNQYLLVQTESIADIYYYETTLLTFIKHKSIRTEETIHQILPIHSPDHSILSDYNLLLFVGNNLSLRYYSLSKEIAIKLSVSDRLQKEQDGYSLSHIYFNENSNDGRFAIWWENSSAEGFLSFYFIEENNDKTLSLKLDSNEEFSNTSYTKKPFKIAYRNANSVDHGGWKIIVSDQSSTDTYLYENTPF